MMSRAKIYLAGKMSGLSYEEIMTWRKDAMELINFYAGEPQSYICPPLYYSYDAPTHKTEREVKQFELNALAKCDVVLVNLYRIAESVGTIYELSTADCLNHNGHHISIIGFGSAENVHPWILDSLMRHEDTLNDAAEYIADYLVN